VLAADRPLLRPDVLVGLDSIGLGFTAATLVDGAFLAGVLDLALTALAIARVSSRMKIAHRV